MQFDNVEGGFDSFGFFNGDGSVFTNLIHGFGDDVADFHVPVSGDSGDLGDFLGVRDFLGDLSELSHDGFGSLHDAALEADWIGTGGDVAKAFFVDGFRKHGSGGSSVTCDVGGLGGDFLDELSAHVLVGIFEFDFFGNRDTVFGDSWGTELLVDDDVATCRPESCFHRTSELGDAAEESLTSCFVELELFSHNFVFLKLRV